jgi:hypothetical protein
MRTKRRRKLSLLSVFYFMATLGLMVGGSIWLDDRGETVTAKVAGKYEEVQVSDAPQGMWVRFYRVGVEFPAANDAVGQATVTVPLEQYDALHLGDSLPIRYLPAFPLLARPTNRSTMTVVYELGSRFVHDPILFPLILWLVGWRRDALGGDARRDHRGLHGRRGLGGRGIHPHVPGARSGQARCDGRNRASFLTPAHHQVASSPGPVPSPDAQLQFRRRSATRGSVPGGPAAARPSGRSRHRAGG